jgi:hypothetical protein
LPNVVVIKSIKKYLRKSCSAFSVQLLVKLSPLKRLHFGAPLAYKFQTWIEVAGMKLTQKDVLAM